MQYSVSLSLSVSCPLSAVFFVGHHSSLTGEEVEKAEAYGEANTLTCSERNYKTQDAYRHTEECHYIASAQIPYRWACAHRQTHRVEEDSSINYSLETSAEEILIVSESLIEFRWPTCADVLLVKP